MEDNELILICAVRYALRRHSYIVGVVAGYVANKSEVLSEACKDIIIRDIREEIEMCHRVGRTCGMEMDERTWLNLLEFLGKN